MVKIDTYQMSKDGESHGIDKSNWEIRKDEADIVAISNFK